MQMRLNEDFFDDNKITGDDIESSSDNQTAAVECTNPEKWYREMQLKYLTSYYQRINNETTLSIYR